ncbi:MAG: hypothetical protein WC788_02255 [Candidatus Paceibacterota bacterium]|jgi:hypothetical protein
MEDEAIKKFVNNTLGEFLEELNNIIRQEDDAKKAHSEVQLELRHVLAGSRGTGIVYDGAEHNARYLLLKLQEFQDKKIGSNVEVKVKHFLLMLPYLSMFEENGIQGMNERINKLFTELKEKSGELTGDEVNERINALNGILYSAIYIFPHLARSIEVGLVPENIISCEERQNLYGHHYTEERIQFDRMKHIIEGTIEKLSLPLPYGFMSRKTGSQDRFAKGEAREEVYFDCAHPKDDWRKFVPTLAVTIAKPIGFPQHAFFSFEEVAYVRFSDKTELTPYYRDGINDRGTYEVLFPRRNHVSHYLSFRGFMNYVSFRQRRDFKKVPDDVWNWYFDNIYEPESFGSEFMRKEYGMLRRDKLRIGFMSARTVNVENPTYDQMMLVEFNEVKLSTDSSYIDTGRIFFEYIMKNKKIRDHSKAYFGNEIIERLLEIPIWERR